MYDETKTEAGNPRAFSRNDLIEIGLKASDRKLRDQVQTWERYTDEKTDVACDLMRGVKSLLRENPTDKALRTLSIGSSEEPQFQLLHALSDGGLWLYDRDREALEAVRNRVERTLLNNVHLVQGDFLIDFTNEEAIANALSKHFGGAPFDLITLHHALYYCPIEIWPRLVNMICTQLLNRPGRMHLALMSSSTERSHTTTWLYNRFAEKFHGTRNNQNLLDLPSQMRSLNGLDTFQFSTRSNAVRCCPKRFDELMAVVWMIMLYPYVHDFNVDQKVEITEFVLDEFWLTGRDLVQQQDYLTISRV